MAYPPVIQDIIDGGDVNPDDFTYGHGAPEAPGQFGELYVDLDTKDVYQFASGTSFDSSFSLEFDTANPYWGLVWNMGDYASVVTNTAVPGHALQQDIKFIAGDSIDNLAFFFPGICYTPTRPVDADDNPIPDPDPADPFNTNTLAVPWEPRAWFSEIRDTYVSTIRYHNGWVPWYGTWPNWVWWDQYSLAGAFFCVAEWDRARAGTLVTLHLSAAVSSHIRPSNTYQWDLESARPVQPDPTNPGVYDTINTWVRGSCHALTQYTLTKVT